MCTVAKCVVIFIFACLCILQISHGKFTVVASMFLYHRAVRTTVTP